MFEPVRPRARLPDIEIGFVRASPDIRVHWEPEVIRDWLYRGSIAPAVERVDEND